MVDTQGAGERWAITSSHRSNYTGKLYSQVIAVGSDDHVTRVVAYDLDPIDAQRICDDHNAILEAYALAGLAQRWRKAIREYGESVTIGLHPRLQDFIDIWHWAKDYDALTAGREETK